MAGIEVIMTDNGYIKIYKKMLKWEWYDDINTKVLFLHCLLRANWEVAKWHGIELQKGQFVTSLASLSKETQLSVQQVRTSLEHLISTGEVTSNQQGKYRIITVNNWCEYQGSNKVSNKVITRCQQDGNKVVTTDKEYKEKKEVKNINIDVNKKHIYGEYKHVRLTQKQYDKLITDYGQNETLEAIKFLDEYIEMKGYKAQKP